MTENATPEEAAREASKPGNFSFLDRVTNRDYPTKALEIYLNEAGGLKIQELLNEREKATDKKAIDNIDSDLALWREKVKESRYIVHMEGISTEEYDKIVDEANEQFPVEYRESRHPLTMALERFAVENEDRDTYFRYHIWAKFIRKIEDINGNVDENITPEFIAVMSKALPIVAQIRIAQAVEELRMTTNWMDAIQGPDFFPKS